LHVADVKLISAKEILISLRSLAWLSFLAFFRRHPLSYASDLIINLRQEKLLPWMGRLGF